MGTAISNIYVAIDDYSQAVAKGHSVGSARADLKDGIRLAARTISHIEQLHPWMANRDTLTEEQLDTAARSGGTKREVLELYDAIVAIKFIGELVRDREVTAAYGKTMLDTPERAEAFFRGRTMRRTESFQQFNDRLIKLMWAWREFWEPSDAKGPRPLPTTSAIGGAPERGRVSRFSSTKTMAQYLVEPLTDAQLANRKRAAEAVIKLGEDPLITVYMLNPELPPQEFLMGDNDKPVGEWALFVMLWQQKVPIMLSWYDRKYGAANGQVQSKLPTPDVSGGTAPTRRPPPSYRTIPVTQEQAMSLAMSAPQDSFFERNRVPLILAGAIVVGGIIAVAILKGKD